MKESVSTSDNANVQPRSAGQVPQSEGRLAHPVSKQDKGRRGPKTQQGKARVRLNAVRHGLCASSPVIPEVERVQDWNAHRAAVLKDRAPVGYLQTLLAERIASLFWRLKRVAPYEAAEAAQAARLLDEDRVSLPPNYEIDTIVRYEAHLSRQLYQAMHEWEALQARRRGEVAPLARLDIHGLPETS